MLDSFYAIGVRPEHDPMATTSQRATSAMSEQDQEQPGVIKQGGNGIGLVVAALIIGGSIVYAINIWSNTKQQMIKALAEAIQKGVESVKKAIQPAS